MNDGWHISKSVTLSHILTTVGLLISAGIFLSMLHTKVSILEVRQEDRDRSLNGTIDEIQADIREIKTILWDMRGGPAAMIDVKDLRELVIEPTLASMEDLWPGAAREAAINLLIGTVSQESVIGGITHLKQVGGPALGIYQIEPDTHHDIWQNYLAFREDKASFVRGLARQHPSMGFDVELSANLPYVMYRVPSASLRDASERGGYPRQLDSTVEDRSWDRRFRER